MSLDSLWRRSFIVGNLAGKIARHQAGDARMASDAFTAGLLHKVGQIILATNLSREYRAVVAAACEKKRPLQEEELAQLGVTSDQVGAYLLGLWGLPLALVEAVGLHYAPAQCGTREFSLLTAVHVAVALADEEHGGEGGLPPAQLDVEYLASLGLPTKPGAWHKALAHEEPAHISRETPQEQCTAPETVPALPLGRLFAVAAVVVSAVIILANRPVSAPRSPPAPAKTVEPLAAKPAPSAQKDGFDSLVLQRIIYHANRSLVIINGRTLGLGETVNGAEILSIEPSSVTLALSGEQKTFTLK